MGKYIYDWKLIQESVDAGLTWRELGKKHGCGFSTIFKARKRGDLVTKGISEAQSLSHKRNPRKHSEITKRKISESRRLYLSLHPDKVPYLLNHHSNGSSYPEKYFADVFEKEGISLSREYRIETYSLDFADIESKTAIEIDGDQHQLDKKIKQHDAKRDDALKVLGWLTLRIRWSVFQKMNHTEKKLFVQSILSLISQRRKRTPYEKIEKF